MCSKVSTNQLYSLQCLHFLCKVCLECIKNQTDAKRKQSDDVYLHCPTCDHCTFLEYSKVSQVEKLCKMPHILQALLDLQYGLLSPDCVVCRTRGSSTKSSFWCFQCLDHYCQECINFHSAMPYFDEHIIYSIEEVQKDPCLLTRARELCDKHNNQLTKVCYTQGMACCDSCISSDHVDVCKGGHKSIEKGRVTALVNPKLSHLKSLLTKVQQELRNEEKKIIDVERETTDFFTKEQNIFKEKSHTLTRILSEKTDRLMAELSMLNFTRLQETESRIIFLNKKLSVMKNAADIISCLRSEPDIKIFLELKKIKNILKDSKKCFGIKEETHVPISSVSFNVVLSKLVHANSFGKIIEHQCLSDLKCQKKELTDSDSNNENGSDSNIVCGSDSYDENNSDSYDENNCDSYDENNSDSVDADIDEFEFGDKMFSMIMSIRVEDGHSHITGCDWKSENEIVFVDQKAKANKKAVICVIDIHTKDRVSEIELPNKPYDIAVFTQDRCVVTIPKDEEVQIYSFSDNSLVDVVNVGFMCHGVCYSSHDGREMIIVAGENIIALFDEDMSEIKRLTVNGEDIRYVHAFSNNLFFYSDLQGNTVYSAIGNGDNRFEYEDMKGTAGLILDEFKNVYVCEKGTRAIHVLSKSGYFLRSFDVSQNPTAISLSWNEEKICIICGGRNNDNIAYIFESN